MENTSGDRQPIVVISSLGTVLVDCFRFLNEDGSAAASSYNRIGGGGFYAIVGARIWLQPSQLGIIVDTDPTGHPLEFKNLDRLGKDIWKWRTTSGSVRACIQYKNGDRTFKYLNPPSSLTIIDLLSYPSLRPKYLHICGSPDQVMATSSALKALEPREGYWKPQLVWEPHPMSCRPDLLEELKTALTGVKVLSPNHEEAAALLSLPIPQTTADYNVITQTFLDMPTLPSEASVVLRCGKLGACVGTRTHGIRWVPSYWHASASEVKEVTGAGNSFLGGLMAGLEVEQGDVYEAAAYGSISASFIVQQSGLPTLGITSEGFETWNNERPLDRLKQFRARYT
ncbi:Carbohydrate kinase PfkB [Phaffia rhodozyma]|uniref:Carbohydrate kinase PfkB n=1 Tax=Phaffia rhodozyma TaxID=264483 RepID=A0A0F7SPG0_PHARH|nr:Carbohydrate kinase PfkB [Phaffia rhodozyma]